jgi:hypothetical protein
MAAVERRSALEAEPERHRIADETELRMMRAALAAERKVVNEFGRRRRVDESVV